MIKKTPFKFILTAILGFCLAYNATAAEIFGSYSKGCIKDAVAFPKESSYHQSLLSHNGRNYAHPDMVKYLNDLIAKVKQAGLPPILIGDISLKAGGDLGPNSDHASHNIGLDVDIPFVFAEPRKTPKELKNLKYIYLVNKNTLTKDFTYERAELIRLAASDPKVTRIFVSPLIKEGLCQFYKGQDRSWLSKVRPWFGHRAHMHVRLACPPDSPYCVNQDLPPEGDGCGKELISWFMPADINHPLPKVKRQRLKMPAQCEAILNRD